MDNPEMTWLCLQFSTDGDSAAQEPTQPDHTQWRLVGAILINNDMKQGCVLTQTLFSIFIRMMPKQATDYLDDEDGVYVRYCMVVSLLIPQCLQAHYKTQERLIRNPFVDDATLIAHTKQALQMPCFCLVLSSPTGRLRFFTCLSLKNTDQPISPC